MGSIVVLDRIKADKDGNIELAPVLLVDGSKITHDAKSLASVKVTASVVGDLRGPKIVIHKFKNKTGYHKRQGHRQQLTARSRSPASSSQGRQDDDMAHKKGASSSRNGRDSNAQRLGVKRFGGQVVKRRRDHRPPARHPLPPRRRTSAVAATTRCSRWLAGAVEFGAKRGRKTVNIVAAVAPLSRPRSLGLRPSMSGFERASARSRPSSARSSHTRSGGTRCPASSTAS